MGSGVYIKKAINKYGVENFEKEILYFFDTDKEALDKEAEIVNEEFIKSNGNYNVALGANTNCWAGMKNKVAVKDTTNNIIMAITKEEFNTRYDLEMLWNGKKHSEKSKQKMSNTKKQMFENNEIRRPVKELNGMYNHQHDHNQSQKPNGRLSWLNMLNHHDTQDMHHHNYYHKEDDFLEHIHSHKEKTYLGGGLSHI